MVLAAIVAILGITWTFLVPRRRVEIQRNPKTGQTREVEYYCTDSEYDDYQRYKRRGGR
jgi:hypothetical protein